MRYNNEHMKNFLFFALLLAIAVTICGIAYYDLVLIPEQNSNPQERTLGAGWNMKLPE